MSKVSITKAAKLAGYSRQHFQTYYVKTGKVSVDRSDKKNPSVDTSELLRVFGKLESDNLENDIKDSNNDTQDNNDSNGLKLENERLKGLIEGLESMVTSQKQQLSKEEARTMKAEERAERAEQHYRALLEDKLKKPETFLTSTRPSLD